MSLYSSYLFAPSNQDENKSWNIGGKTERRQWWWNAKREKERATEKASGWRSQCDKNINLASHAFFSLSPWQQDRDCASIVYSVQFNYNNLSSKATHIQIKSLKLQCMYMPTFHKSVSKQQNISIVLFFYMLHRETHSKFFQPSITDRSRKLCNVNFD